MKSALASRFLVYALAAAFVRQAVFVPFRPNIPKLPGYVPALGVLSMPHASEAAEAAKAAAKTEPPGFDPVAVVAGLPVWAEKTFLKEKMGFWGFDWLSYNTIELLIWVIPTGVIIVLPVLAGGLLNTISPARTMADAAAAQNAAKEAAKEGE